MRQRQVSVRVRCTYPDADLEPTEVTFEPSPELGRTAADVHSRILHFLETRDHVELPAVGEPPLPFWRDTVREVVVR